MGSYITTYTSRHFEPGNPDPANICIEDIAHALSLICRGNGHVKTFWSVGEHCICCAKEAAARGLSNRLALACLLHDAGECYLSDIPRPFKQALPEYREREEALLELIYTKFLGSPLNREEQERVQEVDDDLLWYDLENLLNEMQMGEIPEVHIDLDYTVRPFPEVEREYLELYALYSGQTLARPVYLEDIAEAFETCSDGWSQFLNRRTGEIFALSEDPAFGDPEEGEPTWEEIEDSEDYVRLPDQNELHDKRIMEDFAHTCTRNNTANRLWRALNGRHPYRYFKQAIRETGTEQAYYTFRSKAYLCMAEEWCRVNQVRYEKKG